MVLMAIMKPSIPTKSGTTMWKNRSPVASECLTSIMRAVCMLQKEKNGPGHEKCTKSGENPGRCTQKECDSCVESHRFTECREECVKTE